MTTYPGSKVVPIPPVPPSSEHTRHPTWPVPESKLIPLLGPTDQGWRDGGTFGLISTLGAKAQARRETCRWELVSRPFLLLWADPHRPGFNSARKEWKHLSSSSFVMARYVCVCAVYKYIDPAVCTISKKEYFHLRGVETSSGSLVNDS